MSKDEIKLEYYMRLKSLNYIDLNEMLTQQLAKEMKDVHEQLTMHSVRVSLPSRQEMDRQVVDIMVDTLQIGTGKTEGILMNKLETSYKILNYIEKITGNER